MFEENRSLEFGSLRFFSWFFAHYLGGKELRPSEIQAWIDPSLSLSLRKDEIPERSRARSSEIYSQEKAEWKVD